MSQEEGEEGGRKGEIEMGHLGHWSLRCHRRRGRRKGSREEGGRKEGGGEGRVQHLNLTTPL